MKVFTNAAKADIFIQNFEKEEYFFTSTSEFHKTVRAAYTEFKAKYMKSLLAGSFFISDTEHKMIIKRVNLVEKLLKESEETYDDTKLYCYLSSLVNTNDVKWYIWLFNFFYYRTFQSLMKETLQAIYDTSIKINFNLQTELDQDSKNILQKQAVNLEKEHFDLKSKLNESERMLDLANKKLQESEIEIQALKHKVENNPENQRMLNLRKEIDILKKKFSIKFQKDEKIDCIANAPKQPGNNQIEIVRSFSDITNNGLKENEICCSCYKELTRKKL